MPKSSKFPRLRNHVRKTKAGKVRTYYFYDMRPDGKTDVSLGSNYAEAIQQWKELHQNKPRTRGRLQEAIDQWRDEELDLYETTDTRQTYGRHAARLSKVLGTLTWEDVTFQTLCKYLKLRKAKIQGNREMALLSIVWSYAKKSGFTKLPWPATGEKKWKNAESARTFHVTDC